MTSVWVAGIVVLLAFVNGVRNEEESCATVRASSSVVVLGSPVTATCVIREDCPLVVSGGAAHVEWQLGNRKFPGSTATNGSSRISTVVVPSFNETRAFLTCCVQASPCQIVGGVAITAGYPPPVPRNLSCQTNLSTNSILSCSWDPGLEETHLLTNYTLLTQIWDMDNSHSYDLPQGIHHFDIPRSDFHWYKEMEIHVKAVNALGEASSIPITLEPLRSAKFDPPAIVKIQTRSNRFGCLWLTWALVPHQAWVGVRRLNLEVRLRTAIHLPALVTPVPSRSPLEVCRLLHGTEYHVQIRVRYVQSPWSEWSSDHVGVTLEKAPTGHLDSWLKVPREQKKNLLDVHLFWKPSKQFHANGKNVSYIVLLRRLPGEKGQVCSTLGHNCAFQLPRGTKRVFLCALNAAGKSCQTEVPLLKHKGQSVLANVTVVPHDDSSLLVQWTCKVLCGVTGYVVEWRPLLKTDPSLILFDLVKGNQTSLLIAGSFEPYKPYEIAVYPRFKDGIGHPQTVKAYSKQNAPSIVPEIRVKETWHSDIEISWDEIPLDHRNGIIQNYRIFYWDKLENMKVINANVETRVVLKDLNTLSVYQAFIEASTAGGSLNGSTINFTTKPFDAVTVALILIPAVVGLSSMVIIFMMCTCFSHHKRPKMCLCPMIPDPANSSIKTWTSDTIPDVSPFTNTQEPSPVYLSKLSLMDLSTKLEKGKDKLWSLSSMEDTDTSDLGESICGSPLTPGCSGSRPESVSYATVVFSGPYASQAAHPPPHSYLRSDSTQPLLEAEETFSPTSYQNVPVEGAEPKEQFFFGKCRDGPSSGEEAVSGTLWDDFPLLQALAMNEAQSEV